MSTFVRTQCFPYWRNAGNCDINLSLCIMLSIFAYFLSTNIHITHCEFVIHNSHHDHHHHKLRSQFIDYKAHPLLDLSLSLSTTKTITKNNPNNNRKQHKRGVDGHIRDDAHINTNTNTHTNANTATTDTPPQPPNSTLIFPQNLQPNLQHKNQQKRQHKHHRLLLQNEDSFVYESIRITPDYSSIAHNLNYWKKAISAAISWYNRVLKVVRIPHTFYAPPFCAHYYYQGTQSDPQLYYNCDEIDWSCGPIVIPGAHRNEFWQWDADTEDYEWSPHRNGIQNTDLVIYFTDSNTGCGSAAAKSSVCIQDQFGRPIVGTVSLCPASMPKFDWMYDVFVVLHEMTHILGFSSSSYDEWLDPNGIMYGEERMDEVLGTYNGYSAVITPTVAQITQEHFSCAAFPGMFLEDDSSGMSHFDQRLALSENMLTTFYTGMRYVSKFTFAILADTNYYDVDWQHAMPYYFGYHRGCDFFNADCVSKQTHEAAPGTEDVWCTSSSDDGCTWDHASPAECDFSTYSSAISPSRYQYFANARQGGNEKSEYCPWRETISGFRFCWDTRDVGNEPRTSTFDARYGVRSRCIQTRIGSASDAGADVEGYCFEIERCADFKAATQEYANVHIRVRFESSADITAVCHRSEENQWVVVRSAPSPRVYVRCPRINVICGQTAQPFACYYGVYSEAAQQCLCYPGYTGDDCNVQNDQLAIELQLGDAEHDVDAHPYFYLLTAAGGGGSSLEFSLSFVISGVRSNTGRDYLNGQYAHQSGRFENDMPYYAYYSERKRRSYYLWWRAWKHAWYISSGTPSASGSSSFSNYVKCVVPRQRYSVYNRLGYWNFEPNFCRELAGVWEIRPSGVSSWSNAIEDDGIGVACTENCQPLPEMVAVGDAPTLDPTPQRRTPRPTKRIRTPRPTQRIRPT